MNKKLAVVAVLFGFAYLMERAANRSLNQSLTTMFRTNEMLQDRLDRANKRLTNVIFQDMVAKFNE